MNIVFTSSDSYSKYIPMNIYSIGKNNKDAEYIYIYIVSMTDDDISSDNKRRIENIANHFANISVFYKLVEPKILEDYGIKKYKGSYGVNLKFLFVDIFKELDKVLYLDVDSFVLGNLTNIWDTNMDGNYIAGVVEPCDYVEDEIRGGINYDAVKKHLADAHLDAKINTLKNADYINSGVTLFDLNALRRDGFSSEKMYNFFSVIASDIEWVDMDVINLLFYGKLKHLRTDIDQYLYLYDESRLIQYTHIYPTPTIIQGLVNAKPWNLRRSFFLGRKFWNSFDSCKKIDSDLGFEYPGFLWFIKNAYKTKNYAVMLPHWLFYLLQYRRDKKRSSLHLNQFQKI